MFTIGIFTTHIPYIAFVAFYAFFILFGVGNASTGKIKTPDTQLTLIAGNIISVTETTDFNSSNGSDFSASALFSPGSNEIVITSERYRFKEFYATCFPKVKSVKYQFCRPPPAFI